MDKEIKFSKVFTRYLKEKGLFKQFAINFNNTRQQITRIVWCESADKSKFKGVPNKTFEDYCNKINNYSIILVYAFDWSATILGHVFWENESNNWRNYLNKNFNYTLNYI